jgi:hypothetical protein
MKPWVVLVIVIVVCIVIILLPSFKKAKENEVVIVESLKKKMFFYTNQRFFLIPFFHRLTLRIPKTEITLTQEYEKNTYTLKYVVNNFEKFALWKYDPLESMKTVLMLGVVLLEKQKCPNIVSELDNVIKEQFVGFEDAINIISIS